MARSRTIKVDAGDGTEFDVYLTGDASAGLPLLLCFSTVYGLEDGFRAVADSWADRGYLVAAPDYFHRGGAGVIDRSAPGRARAIARWEGLEVEAAVADAASLVEQASNVASWTGALGAVGYCAGGELAYLAGTRLGAQAVATFHGTHIERHLSEGDRLVRAALHFGAEDELVPQPTVDEIRDGLRSNPGVDVHVHPNAGHGFSFERNPHYDADAARSSVRHAAALLETLVSRDAAGYVHRFVPATRDGSPPLLLLHRTGGSEHDLIGAGHQISPGGALLSPRGNAPEGGRARFFARLAAGVFDRDDMWSRSDQLAELIRGADREHSIGRPVAVGFSNGANIAWSTLLRHPEALSAAVLMRPLMPFDPRPFTSALDGTPVLILGGRQDTNVTPSQAIEVGEALREAGAEVTFEWVDAAHVQTDEDVEIAARWLAAHADRLSTTART